MSLIWIRRKRTHCDWPVIPEILRHISRHERDVPVAFARFNVLAEFHQGITEHIDFKPMTLLPLRNNRDSQKMLI